MTKQADAANLCLQKTRLAEKYEHLVRVSNSRPRQVKLIRQAARYRRQAETAHLLEQRLVAKSAATAANSTAKPAAKSTAKPAAKSTAKKSA